MGSTPIESLVMESLEYRDWKRLYQDALLELDLDKLPERVARAEEAIFSRQRSLSRPDSLREQQALADALANLRVLKRERYGSS